MKKEFKKLGYKIGIDKLKVTPRNRKFIEKFIEHMNGYVSILRIQKYKHALFRFANLVEKDFDKLTYEEVRKAGGIINESEMSVKTKQDIITEVRKAFKYWFGKDQYFPEVVGGLKPPKQKSKLRLPEELPDEKMIYKMIKACWNSRDKFFIALLGLDGALRPIEARNIKWKDIKRDKYGSFITIHTAKKSGDKETRTVRLIKSEPYYQEWNKDYPLDKSDENYLFVNFNTLEQLSKGSIADLFRRLKTKLNWKYKLSPYCLRHSFITQASKNPEWSQPILKKFIGHALASNTISEYQHFGDDDTKDAQLKVNGIIKDKSKKKEERKPVSCAKCKKSNEYDAEFCRFCNTPLSAIRLVESNDNLQKDVSNMRGEIEIYAKSREGFEESQRMLLEAFKEVKKELNILKKKE